MSDKLEALLKAVRDQLQAEAHDHCVGVSVFFSSDGYDVEYRLRSPGSLKRSGISMQNLRGEYIKENMRQKAAPRQEESGEVVTTGYLCEMLGFGIKSSRLEEMGFFPAKKTATSIFWFVSDIPKIKEAIISRLGEKRDE